MCGTCASFSMSGGVAGLGGYYFWGFQWDTMGSDNWDVLWVSVSKGDWSSIGGTVDSTTFAVVDQRMAISVVITVAGLSFNVSGEMCSLGVSYFGGIDWESVSDGYWRSGVSMSISGNWGYNGEISVAGLGFSMSNSVGNFAGGNLGGIEWDTVWSDDWDVLGGSVVAGIMSSISQWGSNWGVDSISSAGIGFSVGGEVSGLGVSYRWSIELVSIMIECWYVSAVVGNWGEKTGRSNG